MTFLMGWPLLLAGALAASIPILIHLLHRQRTQRIQWGAMRFLLEFPNHARRRQRVEHWLLLAARVAALLLLAWALARPLVGGAIAGGLGANSPADIAVVLDHSLSTGATVGDRTIFEQAVARVDDLAQALRAGDTLSVVLAEHQPRALAQMPVGRRDAKLLLQPLHQLRPGLTDCSIPQAIAAARDLLRRGRNTRKLVLVFSDQQKTNWQIGDASAWQIASTDADAVDQQPPQVRIIPLANGAGASDLSVDAITIEPRLVGINRPVQILATLTNHGASEIANANVRLTVDGAQSAATAQAVTLIGGQSVTLRFDHTFAAAGSHWVKVESDWPDALPADNSAVASVQVWQHLPVLIIDGQLTRAGDFRSAQFLRAAMQPIEPTKGQAALIDPTILSTSDSASAKLEQYAVVVLNDVTQLPPELEERLGDYAAGGHGVWVILGPRTRGDFITAALGMQRARLARLGLKSAKPQTAEHPPALAIRSAANPMIAMVASSQRNALGGAATMAWWALTQQDGDDQIVVATAGGDPLIFEHPLGSNGGRAVVWATSADGLWNNWNLMPNFVPLVNETIYHLSAPQTRGVINGNTAAGVPISWVGPGTPAIESVDVVLPDGNVERGNKATYRDGRWDFQYPNTFAAGLYQFRFSPPSAPPAYFGVGVDPKELDPARLAPPDLQWLADHHYATVAQEQDASLLILGHGSEIELWKWLACFLILMLTAETVLTYRMIGGGASTKISAPAEAVV
jgi:hypothetical protein